MEEELLREQPTRARNNRTHEEAPWIEHFDRSELFHDPVIPWDDMRAN
jgi:hypothetical protein